MTHVKNPPPTNYHIEFRDGDTCTARAVSAIERGPDWLTLMDDQMRILFSAPRETILYYEAVVD
ncbi:hypothetical protein ACFYMO_03885 [Streptomyces sp. NPDC007025]|uniref:hypothetical protein n=1 Tax=Streptomyces sp. NPDC007025 TaxID=3364771 RepID=UPI0036CFA7DB